jgi:GTP-binding protein
MLFVGPGVEVYQGMVVGEHQRPGDLAVNVAKKKHLTNVRQFTRDIDVRLTPPRQMSLDEAIEYLADDELLEVTPAGLPHPQAHTGYTEERGKQTKKAKEAVKE